MWSDTSSFPAPQNPNPFPVYVCPPHTALAGTCPVTAVTNFDLKIIPPGQNKPKILLLVFQNSKLKITKSQICTGSTFSTPGWELMSTNHTGTTRAAFQAMRTAHSRYGLQQFYYKQSQFDTNVGNTCCLVVTSNILHHR